MNGSAPTLDAPSRSEPTSKALLGCALNLSEGRSAPVIEAIVSAARSQAAVLDVAPDPDHHRTVVTLGGPPEALVEAVVGLATEAVTRIDMGTQRGVHPRLGAVDVIPFYPVFGTPMALAVAAADRCARTICRKLSVPCFLYEQSSRPAGRTLPWIRRHAFVSLAPDCGPGHPHPSAGACVVGARGLLVAYNVNMATTDLGATRWIAAQLRDGPFALPGIRTLGLGLASRDLTQVSVNIVDPDNTALSDVFDRVLALAAEAGVQVLDSELIGLVPRACLSNAEPESVGLTKPPHILEEAFDRLK